MNEFIQLKSEDNQIVTHVNIANIAAIEHSMVCSNNIYRIFVGEKTYSVVNKETYEMVKQKLGIDANDNQNHILCNEHVSSDSYKKENHDALNSAWLQEYNELDKKYVIVKEKYERLIKEMEELLKCANN